MEIIDRLSGEGGGGGREAGVEVSVQKKPVTSFSKTQETNSHMRKPVYIVTDNTMKPGVSIEPANNGPGLRY